ncbi:MAG: VOC family protein [Pseudomonadota bacterium]
MIPYTTVGTNDLPAATAFYDELLGMLGGKRAMDFGRGYAWAVAPDQPMFCVMKPFDEQAASVGNGVMVALSAGSSEQVDAAYAKAVELGAKDEGAPGARGDGFYGAYFRDLDGNKLCVCHISMG